MTGKLEGKIAFITGIARGQGRAPRAAAGRCGRRHHRSRHLRADRRGSSTRWPRLTTWPRRSSWSRTSTGASASPASADVRAPRASLEGGLPAGPGPVRPAGPSSSPRGRDAGVRAPGQRVRLVELCLTVLLTGVLNTVEPHYGKSSARRGRLYRHHQLDGGPAANDAHRRTRTPTAARVLPQPRRPWSTWPATTQHPGRPPHPGQTPSTRTSVKPR